MKTFSYIFLLFLCTNIMDNDLKNLCLAQTEDSINHCYNIENEDLKEYCLSFFEDNA